MIGGMSCHIVMKLKTLEQTCVLFFGDALNLVYIEYYLYISNTLVTVWREHGQDRVLALTVQVMSSDLNMVSVLPAFSNFT